MPSAPPRRGLLVLATALALARPLRAALPPPGAAAPPVSLAGQLLVAAPEIGDPRFQRAVALVVLNDPQGSLGIVVNQPLGKRPLADLLAALGEDAAGVEGEVRVFAGGPVEAAVGFVLHSTDYRRPETIPVDDQVAMTANPAILRDIARHRGPKKSLVAFGYAGWAGGQLEGEIARRDWVTVADDARLVFDDDRATVWEHARARWTLPL